MDHSSLQRKILLQPLHTDNMRVKALNKKGYMTLLAVFALAGVGVAVTVSLALLSIDASRMTGAWNDEGTLIALADACAEEGMEQLRLDTGYTGTENVSLNGGTCSVVVTDLGGNSRQLNVEGNVNSGVSITNWQIVSSL